MKRFDTLVLATDGINPDFADGLALEGDPQQGSREMGLARADDLGRIAVNDGLGLLEILRAHQNAVNAVLEAARNLNDALQRLKAAESFLMETLSPFEMTYRGYVALLEREHKPPPHRAHRRSTRRHG